jgi:hypothetical protein
MISQHLQGQVKPEKPDMSGSDRTCPVRDWICLVLGDFASENVYNHGSVVGVSRNLAQMTTSTLGTTYSKDRTCIEGLTSRSQD